MKAKVKNDTLFKSQPVLSSELQDSDKVFVPSGSEYELKFFAEAAEHHLRLELANATLADQTGFTWYVAQSDIDLEGGSVTATVLQDTIFKQQPVLASDLTDAEKAFVTAGTELELLSYTAAGSDYLKLTLVDAQLGNIDSNVWFASTEAIKIAGQQIMLKAVTDTVLKAKPSLSSQLSAAEKAFVSKQTTLALQSYDEIEGNYLKITLADTPLGDSDRFTWYAFAPDVEVEGTEPHNQPQDSNPAGQVQTSDRGELLNLPGFHGTYYSNDPIIAGGYFTWAQATHGSTRIPASMDVVYGMIHIAEALEEIRVLLGNPPIEIVSWYRDPATNLRVGGTKSSRHLTGDGVNFVVEGIHPHEVYAKLDNWWGARGGLASASEFTHIDARGYRARWAYQL
ncbi:MAG: peptidase M15 family protein [Leptolyngbya sp. SIOISBB]|nr:peptidase M15 family protein [Leptolyngbya sp. SIOISBB]